MHTKTKIKSGAVVALGLVLGCGGIYDVGSGEAEQGGAGGQGDEPSDTGGTGGSSVSGGGGTGGTSTNGDTGGSGVTGGTGGSSVGVGGDTSMGGSFNGTSGAGGSTIVAGSGGCPSAWDEPNEGPLASSEVIWQRMSKLLFDEVVDDLPSTELDRGNVRAAIRSLYEARTDHGPTHGLSKFMRNWAFDGVVDAEEVAERRANEFFGDDDYGSLFAPFGDPEEHRHSFLSERVILEAYPTISLRGAFMLDRLFCSPIQNIEEDFEPVTPGPNETTRQALRTATSAPACAACHLGLLDPVGGSLDHFDAVGDYRETENSVPIDASGSFSLSAEGMEFTSIEDLAPQLAESSEVSACVPGWFHGFALEQAHAGEVPAYDPVEKEAVVCEFIQRGRHPLVLLEAVVDTPAFLRE